FIGGIFAAITFTVARMAFTAVMAQSSYSLVYGAFATAPLFLLWIYITWIIVLLGAVITHGMSAYQTTEQSQTPTLMKALDILYLFWRAQQEGRGIAELEIIGANDLLPGRIDADSWRRIRDSLTAAQLLKRLDRGHYLLCKDLHTVSLAALADLLRAEPGYRLTGLSLPWQQNAATLLSDNKDHESQCLNVSLADLFVTPKV
ncbi:YihY/virulence factor BrkB family protein, partial [Luminiphilus sp.]|nr:YihY/virulence factor BrkB family protein [Luminiphilus sp.]